AEKLAVVAFLSVNTFVCLELLIQLYILFKRRTSMYFWSLLVTILGALFAVPFCILFVWYPAQYPVLSAVGIAVLYTIISVGNSLVLYSRLHLVTRGLKPRWVLWMIIGSTVVIQLPHLVLLPAAAATEAPRFTAPEQIIGHLAVTAYAVREFIILGVYAYEVVRNLRPLIYIRGTEGKRLIVYLVVAGSVAFLLDTAIMVFDYRLSPAIVAGFIPFVSTVKVKVEFASLNKLVHFMRS
ncbi:hypothetical protein BO71DRAFT_309820, partial [Aspergillus ellipticus CBS 707.79]